ncbi:UNVERIFIED_CONTAM: hypothetical protein RMT77_011742 [Armadillidium vulgare]
MPPSSSSRAKSDVASAVYPPSAYTLSLDRSLLRKEGSSIGRHPACTCNAAAVAASVGVPLSAKSDIAGFGVSGAPHPQAKKTSSSSSSHTATAKDAISV